MRSGTFGYRVRASQEKPPGLERSLVRFFNATADPTLVLDEQLDIVFANTALGRLVDRDEIEVRGNTVDLLIHPELRAECRKRLEQILQQKDQGELCARFESIVRTSGGLELACDVTATRHDYDGARFAICCIHSHAEAHRADPQLRLREARLNQAQRIAKIGNWEWGIVSGSDWWSDELYRMLGVDPDKETPSFDLFISMVHEDDRERLVAATNRTLTKGGPHAIDVRIVLRDGEHKTLHSQGEVYFDEHGQPIRMAGTLLDVTERKAVEADFRSLHGRYENAQRLAKVSSWERDLDSDSDWWSNELYRLLEEDPATCPPSFENFVRKLHPDDQQLLIETRNRPIPEQDPLQPPGSQLVSSLEARVLMDDGRQKLVEILVEGRSDERGRIRSLVGTILDITDRRRLEKRLTESEQLYSSTVELAALGIAHIDISGRFLWANKRLLDMLGYGAAELIGRSVKDISHPEDRHLADAHRRRLHAGETESVTLEKRYIRKNGSVIWVRISSSLKRDAQGTPLHDISIVENVSDRKAAEERVHYLATHDELTGLPNRTSFHNLAERAIDVAKRERRSCALLYIDLDRLKTVNDGLGHHAGDVLLKETATRLKGSFRSSDLIARIGGDEFVVLLPKLESPNEPSHAARRLLRSLRRPISILGREWRGAASIGIASYPLHSDNLTGLLQHADAAMYLAKQEGRGGFRYYSPKAKSVSASQLDLETRLNSALERGELSIEYQPRISLRNGTLQGAEALLRWHNADFGQIAPARFIALAEETGLIVPLGKWVLRSVCERMAEFKRAGFPDIVFSVNLSPRQFADSHLLGDIAEIIDDTGIDPTYLELEITESNIIQDVIRAISRIDSVKGLGVKIAIDDFGKGYSSFTQLKRFPFDTLKIDSSFIRDLPHNQQDLAITQAIVSIGHTLGLKVVAEGVENSAQYDCLRTLACNEAQGFFTGRPGDAATLAGLLRGGAD